MGETGAALDRLCIDTIRTLSIDAIQRANSGHPGLPMGAAPMAYVLWQRHLKHNPGDPSWPDRDRFVLSGGHGSMLLYSLLHLTGYPLTLEEIRSFRQWQSKTPGHPEAFLTPGVEATTGPLGQGLANAVGMAIAERSLAHTFNRDGHEIVDHHTYALVTDGDVMEGVALEAVSLAGHLRLGKLIMLYDANDISLDGPLTLTFTEDVGARFAACNWHVLRVSDGDNDLGAIDRAISQAQAETGRPSLIIVKTTIGFGSPNKAGTSSAHGSPLGPGEVKLTKAHYGWDPDATFVVPAAAREVFDLGRQRGAEAQAAWQSAFARYSEAYPELATEWHRRINGDLPSGWDAALPAFPCDKAMATRAAGGKVLNALAPIIPEILGGDADLSCSTKTAIDRAGSFDGQSGSGRNIHFGVREHAMGAIANGIAYHGSLRPYVSTFFCFSDYMRPSVRLAAMNHLPVIYVWTHDSIALGEDGPTHQPVEHLSSLRAMPNLFVLRPCDANETREAWCLALRRADGPTALIFTRQDLPTLDRASLGAAEGLHRGAYVLYDPPHTAQALLIATGSEIALSLEAARRLTDGGIPTRVVSMPCWKRFEEQPLAYREAVLPPAISARVSVEAGTTFGWSRWVGDRGRSIGVDRFGASAPDHVLLEQYGLTVAALEGAIRELVAP